MFPLFCHCCSVCYVSFSPEEHSFAQLDPVHPISQTHCSHFLKLCPTLPRAKFPPLARWSVPFTQFEKVTLRLPSFKVLLSIHITLHYWHLADVLMELKWRSEIHLHIIRFPSWKERLAGLIGEPPLLATNSTASQPDSCQSVTMSLSSFSLSSLFPLPGFSNEQI